MSAHLLHNESETARRRYDYHTTSTLEPETAEVTQFIDIDKWKMDRVLSINQNCILLSLLSPLYTSTFVKLHSLSLSSCFHTSAHATQARTPHKRCRATASGSCSCSCSLLALCMELDDPQRFRCGSTPWWPLHGHSSDFLTTRSASASRSATRRLAHAHTEHTIIAPR